MTDSPIPESELTGAVADAIMKAAAARHSQGHRVELSTLEANLYARTAMRALDPVLAEAAQLATIGRQHLQAGNIDDALTAFNRIAALRSITAEPQETTK